MRPYFWGVALGGLHLTHGFAEGQLDRVVWTVPGVTSRHWGPLILANMFQPIWPQKVLLRNDRSELGVYWVLPTFSHQSSVWTHSDLHTAFIFNTSATCLLQAMYVGTWEALPWVTCHKASGSVLLCVGHGRKTSFEGLLAMPHWPAYH